MTIPFHQRLLRAARQAGAASPVVPTLSGMAAQLQRSLGLQPANRKPPGAQVPPVTEAPTLQARSADILGKLEAFGLGRLAPFSGSTAPIAGETAMLARQFTAEAGARPYRLFVPSNLPNGPGLIIMLHGCTQSPEDFAAGTRMNEVAGAQGFLVLYPEQIRSANVQRCWNWFNPADQRRDQGEPSLIAGMTRAVMAEFKVDKKRVFVAGLSAGGAGAAIMGAAYPDLYAAIGVHSGLACGAAHDIASAFAAMQQGKPGTGSLTIPTIIFHGDRDGTVNKLNADAVAAGIAGLDSARIEHGQVPQGLAYTRAIRRDARQRPVLEQWTVHGAGHAWSGGSAAGSFTEPKGPDASAEMLRFFQEQAK
jgi:poly(hydroxyalkanoate) depolymerase family esterase